MKKKHVAIALAAAGAVVSLAPGLYAGAIINDPGFTTNAEARNDDGSTAQINLPFTLNFFGQTFSHAFVNTNGNITFSAALSTFTPGPIVNNSTPIIAPYWADWDTRPT